jgi:hypothetical protein
MRRGYQAREPQVLLALAACLCSPFAKGYFSSTNATGYKNDLTVKKYLQ